MRDEPERRNRFQCGMSRYELAEEGAMLRVNEYHHAEHRTTDVGADTRVCGGEVEPLGLPRQRGKPFMSSSNRFEIAAVSPYQPRPKRDRAPFSSRAQLTRWIGRWMKT